MKTQLICNKCGSHNIDLTESYENDCESYASCEDCNSTSINEIEICEGDLEIGEVTE